MMWRTLIFLCIILTVSSTAQAGFWDKAKEVVSGVQEQVAPATGEDLSVDEITSGLKEALKVGAERAVEKASAKGGFLDNPSIRIPLPDKLNAVGNTMRTLGMGGQVDTFEETMNRAAERASSEAAPIFGKAIQDLTMEDVRRLWKGEDTAVTDYFRTKTWEPLAERFKPVVHATAEEVGVTRAYNNLVSKSGIEGLIGGTQMDLDHYVTDNALDGLFKLLAAEEKKIRTDPVARTTDLLKKVFGE